jgi:undecaprenyl-diphosphatase
MLLDALGTRRFRSAAGLVLVLVVVWCGASAAFGLGRATSVDRAARHELTAGKAAVLGVVEGLTEYLPVSSTGHLEIAERLLDIGTTKKTKDAADTYTIVIQAGAILAVLVLFWGRIVKIVQGLFGRSEDGRRLLIALAVAFVPAAIVGIVGEKAIKSHLLKPVPIAAAWVVGAIAILVVGARLHRSAATGGRRLEELTTQDALIIGAAQVLALWPGTSRSLVTILAALVIGLSLSAAVEFSFLLGLLTLGAATFYDGAKHGKELVDTYGVANPLLGFVIAFVAALVAVRWMVTYLQRHDLTVFAWYRIAAAAVVVILLAAGTI